MKTCIKCGKDYPDIDNFCISCGAKLQKKKLLEHSPMDSHIHKRVERLEKTVKAIPHKPSYVHVLRKRMDNFEKQMGSTASTLRTSLEEIDKKADRLSQVKFMPKQDAMSIVRELTLLDKKITGLKESIKGLRSDMPKAEHILGDIEQKLVETRGTLFTRQQHELEEMARKIGMLETRMQENEKDIEEGIDKLRKGGGADISRFLSTVNDNKNRIKEMEGMKQEFEEMKKRSASFNAQEIRENILTDFEKINTNLVETVEQKKSEIHRIEQETAQMREGIESLMKLEDKVKGVNAEGITRDLEILKTKTKWLEEQIEGLDIKPIHERICELETDLKRITSSSPMVLE